MQSNTMFFVQKHSKKLFFDTFGQANGPFYII
jgi:hypothetical protein